MTSQPPTILLVEDNEDNVLLYRTYLEYRGFRVVVAGDGLLALRLAREELPRLILMDLSLPRLSGFEVTEQLKSDPATHHIPIIALTAHVLDAERDRALKAGCDGFLAKPITPRDVTEEVLRWVQP